MCVVIDGWLRGRERGQVRFVGMFLYRKFSVRTPESQHAYSVCSSACSVSVLVCSIVFV